MLRSLTCVYCDMCEIRVNVQVKGAAIAHLCRKSENVSMYGTYILPAVGTYLYRRLGLAFTDPSGSGAFISILTFQMCKCMSPVADCRVDLALYHRALGVGFQEHQPV